MNDPRRRATSILLGAATALLLASGTVARAAPVTTARAGTTFTWTVDTTTIGAIASFHITGPTQGSSPPNPPTGPPGWTFSGSSTSGDYSWEGPANIAGPLTFSITFLSVVGTEAAQSVSFDTINTTTSVRTNIPYTLPPGTTADATNWAMVPSAHLTPEPTGLVLVGSGLLAMIGFARRTPRRRR